MELEGRMTSSSSDSLTEDNPTNRILFLGSSDSFGSGSVVLLGDERREPSFCASYRNPSSSATSGGLFPPRALASDFSRCSFRFLLPCGGPAGVADPSLLLLKIALSPVYFLCVIFRTSL